MDGLASLLQRLPALFPASSPLVLKPSANAFAPVAARFSGGHAARWFAASDGQEGERPFALAHSLCSLAEALEAMRIADELRAGPDGYWVESHWLAIASDLAGQHLMVDDYDGRVLSVAHDDDHVDVVAPSVEAWLQQLLDGHARGTIVWDEVFGLIEASELARVDDARETQRRRRQPGPMTVKEKVGLALAAGLSLTLFALLVWFLERGR